MSKHTPGKWRIGYKDGSGHDLIIGNKKAIAALRWGCSCCKNISESFEGLTKEEQANAHLIAAAPEMLDALKMLDCKSLIKDKKKSHTEDCIRCSAITKAAGNL